MKEKIVFILGLIVLFSLAVQAETIKEETFALIGYSEFSVEEANQKKCSQIVFYEEFNQEEFTIISIHTEFTPKIKGNANITVHLNNELISVIDSETEFERIIIQKEKLKEKNEIQLCAFTSDAITRISVKDDSTIGNYKTAFFPEGSLKKEVLSKEIIIGKEITIKTSLKNYGNEKTSVEIIDGDADREDIELIKGKSSFKGEILPGEEVSFEYTYRLKNAETRLLPNAKAYYLNEFNEKKEITSNYPEIFPSTKQALEPLILLKKQINFIGEESEIEIAIINNSENTVYNAEIKLTSEIITGEKQTEFESIQPKEIVYFKTKAKSDSTGEFELNCQISYGNETTACKKTTIIFEENTIDQKLIIGSVMVLIGIIIYVYLYLR